MYSYIAKRFKNFELKRIENLDEEIILHIINTSYTAPCTVCGLESKYVHQEFTKTIYDCAYENKTTKVVFNQRRYKCKNPYCSQNHFIESLDFLSGKRPFSSYLVDKIMENKDKSLRTISNKILEEEHVSISKSAIGQLINDYQDNQKYANIEVVRLDKVQLEKNIDSRIDCIDEIAYMPADYIIDEVDRAYSLINNIEKSFMGISDYKTTYPTTLFITAGLTARIKRLVASSSMPFSLTLKSSIEKIGYNFLKQRADGTYFSNGAFRDYILNTNPDRLQEGFQSLSSNLLKNNNITPSIHILDATDIAVNQFNPNYENASSTRNRDDTTTKGYKLTSLYGLYDDGLVHESSRVDTLKLNDLKAGEALVKAYSNFKKGDIVLVDRGYTSFSWFYQLKKRGINIVTPAKKDSEVLKTALSLVGVNILDNIKGNSKRVTRIIENKSKDTFPWQIHPNKKRRSQQYTTVNEISLYENFNKNSKELKVNAVVIRFKRDQSSKDTLDTFSHYYEDDAYRYAVIYTTDLTKSGKDIINLYEKRMKIEEQFKQLKSNWDLSKLTSTKYIFVIFQLLSTINALGIVQLFTTLASGKEFKNCSLQTIIRKLEVHGKYNKTDLIVSSRDVFATYKLSEAFELILHKEKSVQEDFIKHLRIAEGLEP